MRLILTRHGETEENKAGIIQGHLPGRLSKLGILQAKKVAKRLKDEEFDVIYSSDLARAVDTAKEVHKFHSHVPINFVKELRETFFGDWQGKSKKELGLNKHTMGKFPDNGESFEEMFVRARNFLDNVFAKHKGKTVLFSGHNGINKAFVAVITGKSASDIKDIESQHNTAVCIFEIHEDKEHKMLLFNCVRHLD